MNSVILPSQLLQNQAAIYLQVPFLPRANLIRLHVWIHLFKYFAQWLLQP